MTKEYVFTDEARAALAEWQKPWTANERSTVPMTEEDRAICRVAMAQLYKDAGYTMHEVVFARSPYSGAFAAAMIEAHVVAKGSPKDAQKILDAIEAAIDSTTEPPSLENWYLFRGLDKMDEVAKSLGIGKAWIDELANVNMVAHGGNQWSSWEAEITFARDHEKLGEEYGYTEETWRRYAPWETMARHSGRRFVLEEVAIICDRPVRCVMSDDQLPHALGPDGSKGPWMQWADGYGFYQWRGTRIPAWIIEQPERLTPAAALKIEDVEVRRCACEILGWDKILSELKADVVDEDPDPYFGTLLRVDLPDAPGEQFLRARCGTGRTVVVAVDRNAKTAVEAGALSYGMPVSVYRMVHTRT